MIWTTIENNDTQTVRNVFPTSRQIQWAREIALEDQYEDGSPFTCESTSKHVRDEVLNWSLREGGIYVGPDIFREDENDVGPYAHHWLRLEDGSILDATANQFGDEDIVRVLPLWDHRQIWYVAQYDDGTPISTIWNEEHPAVVAFKKSRELNFRIPQYF